MVDSWRFVLVALVPTSLQDKVISNFRTTTALISSFIRALGSALTMNAFTANPFLTFVVAVNQSGRFNARWRDMKGNIGSLNRRLLACFFDKETTVPAASGSVPADLELYVAWRSQDLPIEAPAVRR